MVLNVHELLLQHVTALPVRRITCLFGLQLSQVGKVHGHIEGDGGHPPHDVRGRN